MRIVLANGCFDIIHIGHLQHLKEAREFGDWLVVSLTEDDRVKKGPGRPINKWNDRAAILRELRCVGEVIPTSSAMEAIRLVKPAFFVKGIDYANGGIWTEDVEATCKEVGAEIRFTKSPKQSVNDIIRRANELACNC